MRWSIRTQILIPLIGIQAVTVTAVALATATVAARRSEREIIARLNDVIDTLRHGNIPYTASVLAKMRGLSGAHFIAAAEDARVTETSLPLMENLPDSLRSVPTTAHLDTLADCPGVVVAGMRYVTVSGPVAGWIAAGALSRDSSSSSALGSRHAPADAGAGFVRGDGVGDKLDRAPDQRAD